jgi:hypothetical protein
MDRVALEVIPMRCSYCIALRNLGDSIQGGQAKIIANKTIVHYLKYEGTDHPRRFSVLGVAHLHQAAESILVSAIIEGRN